LPAAADKPDFLFGGSLMRKEDVFKEIDEIKKLIDGDDSEQSQPMTVEDILAEYQYESVTSSS
jgi:hypothetical protein